MKINQVEHFRAVASLLVVLFHIEITFRKYFVNGLSSLFLGGNSGVQIFFVISGFVMYLVHRGDASASWASVRRFAIKRFERIYPPLWVVLILVAPIVYPAKASLWDLLASFLILPVNTEPSLTEAVLSVEWTLRHEVLFYLFFTGAIYSRRVGVPLMLAWGVLGSIVGLALDNSTWLYFFFNPNHLLFIAGIVVAHFAVKAVKGDALRRGPVILAIGTAGFVLCWAMGIDDAIDFDQRALGFGISFALILSGMVASQYLAGQNAVMKTLADSSYAIYLVHFPLISVFCKLIARIGGADHDVIRYLYGTLTFAACVAAGIGFHKLVEAPLIGFFRNRRIRSARALP